MEIDETLINSAVVQVTGPVGSNFVMNYYLDSVCKQGTDVTHLCYYEYDVARMKHVLGRYPDFGPGSQALVKINECIELHDFSDMLDKKLAELKKGGAPSQIVIIDDLDSAFNVAAFNDYATAGEIITSIMRKLRRLAQSFNVTCLLSQRSHRPMYTINYVTKLVHNCLDIDLQVAESGEFVIKRIL